MKKTLLGMALTMAATVVVASGALAQDVPTVRYGIYEPGLDSGFLLMAQEKDFWAEHGVNVEVVTFKSARQIFPAFVAGEVDVIQANPSEAILASAKGADIKFVGSTMPGLNYALYASSEITSLQDLVGKTVGISAPTALPAVVVKAMLIAQDIDPESVTYANSGGSPERYLAVVNGVVDAASSPSDYMARAQEDGVKILAMAKDVIPDYPRYALITSDAFLQSENGEGVTGLLAGLMQGMRYAFENPAEAHALSAKTVGGLEPSDPSIQSTYSEFMNGGYLALNAEIPVQQMKYLADLQARLGISPEPVAIDPLIDDSYRQKALELVGEVRTTYYGSVE